MTGRIGHIQVDHTAAVVACNEHLLVVCGYDAEVLQTHEITSSQWTKTMDINPERLPLETHFSYKILRFMQAPTQVKSSDEKRSNEWHLFIMKNV